MEMTMHELIETCNSIITTDNTRILNSLSGERLSTFSLGGPVSCFIETTSLDDLCVLMQRLTERNLSIRPLGNGSNIVFPDEGVFSAPVTRFIPTGDKMRLLSDALSDISGDPLFNESEYAPSVSDEFRVFLSDMAASLPTGNSYTFRIHAGASLMSISRSLSLAGFHGLEFAAGIPGTAGGAVVMNAGAHGSDFSSVISHVHCINKEGSIHSLSASEIDFTYRSSSIPKQYFVVAVDVILTHSDPLATKKRREEALLYRKKTQPLTFPSAGSVFRNPVGNEVSAGSLLDRIGLKGKRRGGVSISDIHANWIVKNGNDACSSDVHELLEYARTRAMEETGILLQPEILFWES
jgi:UDP-N-acetylenolpyruvoylglucosamine reductase